MSQRVNKHLVMRHFSLHAGDYDGVTPVQAALGKDLLDAAIDAMPFEPGMILELGCGTGRLTAQLMETWPEAEILAVDLSPDMIEQARCAIGDDSKVTFITGDAEDMVELLGDEGPFDLIISNAMVQWLNHPAECLKDYFCLLNDDGVMSVSAFGEKTFHELQTSFFLAEEMLGEPHVAHVMPLPGLSQLASCFEGITTKVAAIEQEVLCPYPSVRSLLRNIRRTGANLALDNSPRSLSRKVYSQFEKLYTQSFPTEDGSGIEATYHTLMVVARKGK